ncbi:choice-of-anchor M domain-containing protein [Oerskovia flava]|uniref:choice-of-anchor M domain-containing protein n=1 Tax=Oerskovia flava TaxID=2986422 RepID=UPI00223F69E5|nr:choice-of-anchor M domain-containing protein [Oerskovia sp. JB1-3-2]
MTTHSPPRRAAAILTALTVAVGGALSVPTAAFAAEGPAPAPTQIRVVGGVHTDAVSTFLDDGRFSLASKADVAEGNGTRFAADDVWFHLEDDAQRVVTAGFEFIAPVGSTVWTAPESNPGAGRLWPGFNTESVASGAIDDNRTTFTLTDVEGPGDLEVFTGGGLNGTQRLWSSRDDDIRSFQAGRTHLHANWAFTAPGTYRLGVEGAVTVDGTEQTAQATYTFVVGDLPDAVETATTLATSSTELVTGDPLTLTAQVSPADARGFVEFRNGSTVLGHDALSDGTAVLTTTAPAVGRHDLTAVYVPSVANLARPSTSDPTTVTVSDGSGDEFGIAGVASSYQVGDVLEARVVGHTLAEGQTYRWAWRPVGVESSYALTGTGGQEAAGRLTLPLDRSHDGYEVSVSIRQGSTTVTRSSWVTLTVESDVAPLTGSFPADDLYLGDEVLFTLDDPPADGDEVRLAYRFSSDPWTSADPLTTRVDATTLRVRPEFAFNDSVTWVVQTVRDGRVVAQSDPVRKAVPAREVMLQGLQGVYRTGQTLNVTADVYPELAGATYSWEMFTWNGETMTMDTVELKEGSDPSDLTVELPLEAHHDGWTLGFEVRLPDDSPLVGGPAGWYYQNLTVFDADPDTQLFFFESLGGHYHQGGDIGLKVVADPGLADGDSVAWEWRWPGTDEWTAVPDASGLSHALVAEQALDGVEVRATLSFAGGGENLVAKPVTILVDDHGAAPLQVVSITGPEVQDGALTATAGEPIEVTAEVSPETVLDSFQWFVQLPGADEPAPVQGATSATYELAAAPALDGAALSVAVVRPDGSIAYGPSSPVVMTVKDSDPTDPGPDPDPDPDPDPGTDPNPDPGTDPDQGGDPDPEPGEDEEPVPGAPSDAPRDRTATDLDGTPEGGIELGSTTVTPGDFLVVDLGREHAHGWAAAWLFSTPTLLNEDWTPANGAGAITVRIPADTPLGTHRLAVYAADESLIGWADVTVAQTDAPPADDAGSGDEESGDAGSGTAGSGTAGSGAEMVGGLASTGGAQLAALGLALLLTVAGVALVVVRRRRRGTA